MIVSLDENRDSDEIQGLNDDQFTVDQSNKPKQMQGEVKESETELLNNIDMMYDRDQFGEDEGSTTQYFRSQV